MAIRIVRNEQGNCINFYGSSNPTYWNACLSGEVDSTDTNAVNVINDIITAQTGITQYEFFRIPYTEFVDAQGNGFTDAQAAADYITEKANVVGLGGGGTDLIGKDVCFKLDETSTSIMLDNGYAYGVNTIKAVEEGGHIKIQSFLGDIIYFTNLEVGRVCDGITGNMVPGGLNDVINWLNELFTVGAFQEVVISDPFSTLVADVDGVPSGYTLEGSTVVDPVGDAIATNSASGNYAGILSQATIDQPGEYFTFDIQGEGQIGFGLVHTQQSYDDGFFSGSPTYADPSTFAVTNSAHYGFQFSHWFHPTPNGSWTNYGANTSYSMQPGWYDANNQFEARDEWLAGDPIKIRVGLDENGYIAIYSLKDDGITWVKHARTSYPQAQGAEFRLGVKFANASSKVYSAPKIHRLDSASAPTTLGDQTISTFGDGLTGTISGGGVSAISIDSYANDGIVSNQVINSVGEFFEFEWSGQDSWFGLFSENEHNVSDLVASANADEDWTANSNEKLNDFVYYGSKANGNNGNIQYQLGNVPYSGALNQGNGNYFARVGFDSQGRASVWVSNDGGNLFTLFHHATSTAAAGDYKFIWIPASNGAVLESLQQGTISSAPVMNFRYIESPDGVFNYPLFATAEEAEYYDEIHNGLSEGTGSSHTHVYVDDATNTTWYMPQASHDPTSQQFSSAPSNETFSGQPANYTEITSLTDSDFAPSPFILYQQYMIEGGTINHQLSPQDVDYTTTISGQPVWMSLSNGYLLTGTANYVSADTDYIIDVTRTNSYGSTTSQITVTVQDDIVASQLSGITTAYGNTLNPNHVFQTERFAGKLNTTISQGQEISWTHRDFTVGGFLTLGGESNFDNSSDVSDAGNWDLRFSTWSNALMQTFSKGWAVGGSQNMGNLDGSVHKMVYKNDGYVEFYTNDVLYYTSASNYTGDKNFYLMTPDTYNLNIELPVDFSIVTTGAGSTTAPSGFNSPLTQGETGGTDILGNGADAVATSIMTVTDGYRLIITESWIETNVLPYMDSDEDKVFLGIPKTTANWNSVTLDDFDMVIRLQKSGNGVKSLLWDNGANDNEVTVNSLTDGFYNYAFEWDGTDLSVIANTTYGDYLVEPSIANGGSFDRVITHSGFTQQSGDLPFVLATNDNGQVKLNPYFLGMSIPAAPVSNLTPWTKALDFSGSNEHTLQVSPSSSANALRMQGLGALAPANSDSSKTSDSSYARPWATAIVFKYDGNSSNQHIWNSGEGAGSTDDNIYLRLDASGYLYFGWGRQGALNECRFLYLGTSTNTNHWHGIYIAHNGTRLSGSNATAANLAACFDIRWFTTNFTGGEFGSWMDNKSTAANWTAGSTGGRMDRAFAGNFTIGGRGSNRNFHGKVASMVITHLKLNSDMPTDAEIELMMTDPKKWEDDYRVGQQVRQSLGTTNTTYSPSNLYNGYGQTQIWLMGDGSSDSYANGVRNEVYPSDQNYTKLQLNSMVSNDIETVNISGLS